MRFASSPSSASSAFIAWITSAPIRRGICGRFASTPSVHSVCLYSSSSAPSTSPTSWLREFGRISYGLYLFHSLVFFLVFEKLGPRLANRFPQPRFPARLTDLLNAIGAAMVLLLSIGLAHLSYRYFERPFLRLKERFNLSYRPQRLIPHGMRELRWAPLATPKPFCHVTVEKPARLLDWNGIK